MIAEIAIAAVWFEDAASGTDAMRVVKARMADGIAPQFQAHLRQLDPVSVFVLAPVSGAA